MVSINAIFDNIKMWTCTRKIILSFFGESPFYPPLDKNLRWEQQNSLIGGYEDSKNVGKKYNLGVFVDLHLH